MPEKGERSRGRAYARILLTAGGAAAVIAAAIALGGAIKPAGQQDSSPRAMNALRDITDSDVSAPALPWRKSTISSNFTTGITGFPHKKAGERDVDGGGAKHVSAVRNRAHVDERHGRNELVRPRPRADPAGHRHSPRSSPRAKRAPGDPHPAWPDTTGLGGSPSLIEMKCDELFPPHKREFRIRNVACHRLLG